MRFLLFLIKFLHQIPQSIYIKFHNRSVKHENELSLTLFGKGGDPAEKELHNAVVCSLYAVVEQTKTMINLLRMLYCVCF